MRWLIDGYNVMYADGRLGLAKLGREGFRRARRRFLDDISAALGPTLAGQTTIVFDARVHPGDFSLDSHYRGLGVVFALGDENADARIEKLVAADSNPKAMTVVSSDHRIRQAATRRRMRSVTADRYWEFIDDLTERKRLKPKLEDRPRPNPEESEKDSTSDETDHWLETFHEIDELPELHEARNTLDLLLTDAEIAEIEREVWDEL